ncbi:hypothetical protein LINGRAHAP2_LOCUS22884 [Linum grandiflorum]
MAKRSQDRAKDKTEEHTPLVSHTACGSGHFGSATHP